MIDKETLEVVIIGFREYGEITDKKITNYQD